MVSVALIAALLLLAVISNALHAATFWPLLLFHTSIVALLIALVPAPRSHAYTALAVFLVLGYWPKFVLRLIDDRPYLEPIGAFDGSPASWDRALVVSSLGIAGVIVARLLHLAGARRRVRAPDGPSAPPIYTRYRRHLWYAFGVAAVAAYAWNSYAAVHVTGLNPRIVLPLSGNAALAWCYTMAIPLGLSILIGWEVSRRGDRRLSWPLAGAAAAEAAINAASVLSRSSYLMHLMPYALTAGRSRGGIRLPRPSLAVGGLFLIGFAGSLAGVMLMRAAAYPPPASRLRPDAATERRLQDTGRSYAAMAQEVGKLFIDRWTGLEGVLAVTAAEPSPALLAKMLTEDPRAGTSAIYQRVANSHYVEQERFTFLTLAGAVAVFAAGGNPWLVVAGMTVVTLILMAAERTLWHLLRNDLACATLSVLSAFVTVQATFPRLYGIFLIELWLTIGLLGAATAGTRRMSTGPHP